MNIVGGVLTLDNIEQTFNNRLIAMRKAQADFDAHQNTNKDGKKNEDPAYIAEKDRLRKIVEQENAKYNEIEPKYSIVNAFSLGTKIYIQQKLGNDFERYDKLNETQKELLEKYGQHCTPNSFSIVEKHLKEQTGFNKQYYTKNGKQIYDSSMDGFDNIDVLEKILEKFK